MRIDFPIGDSPSRSRATSRARARERANARTRANVGLGYGNFGVIALRGAARSARLRTRVGLVSARPTLLRVRKKPSRARARARARPADNCGVAPIPASRHPEGWRVIARPSMRYLYSSTRCRRSLPQSVHYRAGESHGDLQKTPLTRRR